MFIAFFICRFWGVSGCGVPSGTPFLWGGVCDGPALYVGGVLLAGCWLVCSVFQVQQRWDRHQGMRYTWARWSTLISTLADTRGLTLSTPSEEDATARLCSPAFLLFRTLTHTDASTHAYITDTDILPFFSMYQ